MATASWRRHFSVEEGLDKIPMQIKRAHIDERTKHPGQGHHSTLNLRDIRSKPKTNTPTSPRCDYASDGSSSGFHTSRSRDLSEEIHLPNRLRALSDEISDVSGSRYHGGDEMDSEECSNAPPRKSSDWRSKFDTNVDVKYKPSRYNDGSNTGTGSTGKGRNRNQHEQSWGFMNSEEYSGIAPSVNNSASYPDFDGATSSTSGSLFVPARLKHGHSSSPAISRMSSTLDVNPRRKGNRYSGESPNGTRTSGYASNNTYSELSDFTNYHKSNEPRKFKSLPGPNKQQQDGGGRDHDMYTTRRPRPDHYHNRSSSNVDDRGSRGGPMYSRSISANDSDLSVSSKDRSSKSTEKEKRGSSHSLDKYNSQQETTKMQKVPTIGNVSVTVTNNIQYDPNDPFSFIQPIDLPFHKKVRKCMGPIAAVILLLILAAALGAAIYFASELKDTHEKQIDLLRANLAMKIRNTDVIPNGDSLTSQDLKNLSKTYCKQMDLFYTKSQFKETYRGCEVLSFQNSYLNFTLFFVEKEATSSQIISVIESSAKKVKNASQTFAVVDKFELELENVRVTMERRMEPETFNRKTLPDPTPAPVPKDVPDGSKNPNPATQPTTTPRIPNKPTLKNKPVYSWTPCEDGYNGTYFPHPVDCDRFFHCSNRRSILKNCTTGLLYHWEEFTCVSKFMPNIQCPDPNKAPPRPTTTPRTTMGTTQPATSTDPFFEDFYPGSSTEKSIGRVTKPSNKPSKPSEPSKSSKPPIDERHLTALAGKYSGRPKYSAKPCKKGADGRLYPHPDDCARFIQCVNGKEMLMNCSGGLVFDPDSSSCTFSPNEELVCPDIKPCRNLETGYFPHPYDCTKFIQCQARKEKVLSCSAGLVWNSGVNSCIHDPESPLCIAGTRR